jgi:hypothetical protein
MVAISEYPEIIKRVLRPYASIKPSVGDVDVEFICDDAQGHYELMQCGWIDQRRVHGSVIHIDVRDDKVWIQHDGTNARIAEQLMEAGIPQRQIVLGFHSPRKRLLTEFATG